MSLTKQIISTLVKTVGINNASVTEEDRSKHSKDRSFHQASLPDVVLWPTTTKQVSAILKIANKYKLPVTAWGGGSSLEGNPIPVKQGIVLNMTRMNKVLKVLPDDLQVITQPGIIGEALDVILKPFDLWFAAAPGSKHLATIGGMIANNSGGMHSIKYGVVADAVLALTVVLANGDIINLGSHSFKSSAGYHLKRLFTGSEGTLGIITEVVLKLTPLPKAKTAILVSFSQNKHAVNTSRDLLYSDIKPAAIEFMDKKFVALANKGTGLHYKELPTLLIELHTDKELMPIQLLQIKKFCNNNNAEAYTEYTSSEQLTQLWNFRRAGRPTIARLLPTKGVLSAEIGLPISKIEAFLTKAQLLGKKYKLETIMFGHMGDGNFHGWALYELNNPAEYKQVTKLNNELILFAIKSGGTTTGEHGLGIGKRKFLTVEHPSSISLMQAIKNLLDPKGILNPGKIFPD